MENHWYFLIKLTSQALYVTDRNKKNLKAKIKILEARTLKRKPKLSYHREILNPEKNVVN